MRADKPVQRVTLVPQGKLVDFTLTDGYVTFIIPQIVGHQMVELTIS